MAQKGRGANQYTPLKVRFARSYTVDAASGCWVWHAAISRTDKWGDMRPHLRVNKKKTNACRTAYEMFIGPIPRGLLVRHTCDNTICVNPSHLLTGTHVDNARDMVERGRAAWQKGKPALVKGEKKPLPPLQEK
jgi:hypothetical protein